MPIQKMKKPERGEKVSGSLAFSPSSESKGWNRRIEEAQVQELRLFLPIYIDLRKTEDREGSGPVSSYLYSHQEKQKTDKRESSGGDPPQTG